MEKVRDRAKRRNFWAHSRGVLIRVNGASSLRYGMARSSLIAALRQALRLRHYSVRTEEAYVDWVCRFVRFCGMRHPRELRPGDVTRFLSSLAVERRVSASTQNQALAALVFLYRDVLDMPVGWLHAMVRAKRPGRLPVVFTRDEVRKLLAQLQGGGAASLVVELLYGSGMRLLEALCLRVEVSECGPRVGLAVGVSGGAGVHGFCDSPTPAPPSAPDGRAARVQGGAAGESDRQGRKLSHAAAFLCNSPARRRLRYPNRPRAVGPPQRRDDNDLHARAEPRGTGREKPRRHALINRLG